VCVDVGVGVLGFGHQCLWVQASMSLGLVINMLSLGIYGGFRHQCLWGNASMRQGLGKNVLGNV